MKIVLAPDSFKESLSALAAANAIELGLLKVWPQAQIIKVPMADGGEGTVQAVLQANPGCLREALVENPLGCPIKAHFALIDNGQKAVVEMAAASGLGLLTASERRPLYASSYGTGQLLLAAAATGCREIYLGLGGSATVDGGLGALAALGWRFYDQQGSKLEAKGAKFLSQIAKVEAPGSHPLTNIQLTLAADVDNPLLGPEGAALTYGPQKGASPEEVNLLEKGMKAWSRHLSAAIARLPGSGAAGGLAAGLLNFLPATLKQGVDFVADLVGLDQALKGADLVITGEGAINRQTIHGKVPVGVAKRANCPVIALAGELGEGYEAVYEHHISVCWPLERGPCSRLEAMQQASVLLSGCAERLARTLIIGKQLPSLIL